MSPPVKVAKEGMRKSLYIFRRDFRLYDNKGLTAACKNRYFEDLSPTYSSPTSVININVVVLLMWTYPIGTGYLKRN